MKPQALVDCKQTPGVMAKGRTRSQTLIKIALMFDVQAFPVYFPQDDSHLSTA